VVNTTRALLVILTFSTALQANTLNIGTNFAGVSLVQTVGLGAGVIPPDMGMAVGPNQVVQLVNGGYQVFNKSGVALGPVINDAAFWMNAGIAGAVVTPGISDPRVIFDPGSGRFFAAQINVANTGNRIMLAVSVDSNPLDGWKAVNFTANSGFGDFPMLGLDQNGVYIATNNFTNSSGPYTGNSLFSIPKSDLLLGTPSIANLTSFQNLDPTLTGFGLNPAIDTGGVHGAILAVSATDFFQGYYASVSGSGGAGATLLPSTPISGLADGSAIDMRQPNGTRVVDGGDDRFGSTPFVAGNLLYATNTISDNTDSNLTTHDIVHWLILDLTTKLVLAQGAITDPNFDFTYSSIAADANGDFVIGYNGSGGANTPADNIGAYADLCHFDGVTVTCNSPLLLHQGSRGNYALGNPVRWGDYSAIAVDPTIPNTFWTALEVPIAGNGGVTYWGTQITELSVVPEPGTIVLLCAGSLLLLVRRRAAQRSR
jgi:hypothetical protein